MYTPSNRNIRNSSDDTDKADTVETVEAEQMTPVTIPPAQPKLERPQSLSLQTSEDVEGDDEVKGEIRPQYVHTKSNFDIVEDIKKLSIAQNQATPTSKTPDKGDGDGSRKTPSHLTEQGFFDLKFYHNKLW
ncbi:hypothetical protein QE152_g4284 [Popillia japonica]|uniref:Uncharacterized protein n=1 Tax=Popillia japonica TaxID=7064 RepID=A0AAW1MZF6_POPJA